MKQTFFLVLLFSLLLTQRVQAQFEGTFGVGIHTTYGTEINSLGGGLHAHYYYANYIRFVPSFTCFIERKGDKMWMIDADSHFIVPFSFTSSLYPIAGLHYSQWKHEVSTKNEQPEEKWTKNRLGINLGLGYQHDIAYKIRANFEMKYQFIKGFSQFVFTAGIGFWF